MSFTRGLVATGANLTNFFAHTPVCCPSRSELLTGRYLHNLRTTTGFDKSSNCMHVNASVGTKTGDPLTFAVPLQQSGYATGVYGKYLNSGGMQKICAAPTGDGSMLVPDGWTDYMGACPDTCYTNCNYNINGRSVDYTNSSYTHGSNYGTAVIGNRSLQFINEAMAANWPFFVLVASHAPHGPATPAPWYADLYSTPDVIAPRTPAFGVHSPDKHWMVATEPALTPAYIDKALDSFYKNRMRSLRSVDDIVAAAHAAVEAAGQLEKTYFVFTSDHGLHMGQFCLGPCKRQPYETDIRIPMAVVGPGIPAGEFSFIAAIPDIAPTLVALATVTAAATAAAATAATTAAVVATAAATAAGVATAAAATTLPAFDGRSFAHLLVTNETAAMLKRSADDDGVGWRDAHLVEYFATDSTMSPTAKQIAGHLKDMANNTFIGLRIINATMNLAYFEFTNAVTDWGFEHSNFCELYDLESDPHQLTNVCPTTSAGVLAALHAQLRTEFNCAGESCK